MVETILLIGISLTIVFILFLVFNREFFRKNYSKIIIGILIGIGVYFVYFVYDYLNPEIDAKASIIGSKRYTKNVSDLKGLKENDLNLIKELTNKCKI